MSSKNEMTDVIHNRKRGVSPQIFGSPTWFFLHLITFSYPEYVGDSPEDNLFKQEYLEFFKNLGNVLPCKFCRIHYYEKFNEQDFLKVLSSRDSFTNWLIDFHNKVNVSLGKPTMTNLQVKEMYDKYFTDSCSNSNACGSSLPDSMHTYVGFYGDNDSMPYTGRNSSIETYNIIIAILIIIVIVLGIVMIATQANGSGNNERSKNNDSFWNSLFGKNIIFVKRR